MARRRPALSADGLVEVQPNPSDRRAPLVSLTPRAGQILSAMRPAQARWANHLGSAFTTDQLANAVQVLATIRAMIDD